MLKDIGTMVSRRRCCGLIKDTIVCQTFIPQRRSRWSEVLVQHELDEILLKGKVGLDQAEEIELYIVKWRNISGGGQNCIQKRL